MCFREVSIPFGIQQSPLRKKPNKTELEMSNGVNPSKEANSSKQEGGLAWKVVNNFQAAARRNCVRDLV